ncbi:MAG: transposase [Crocinitomicaceae bacterium]|nr:transposase [Crocinitomicaceae bacterium]
MSRRPRRNFSAEFKTKVVIEALKERDTLEDPARKHELHPNQISTWKKEFLSKASSVFSTANEEVKQDQEAEMSNLLEQIGRQKTEIEWMKKKKLLKATFLKEET